MNDFPIPHKAPIRFVKSLKRFDKTGALVVVGFEQVPTLAMLVESAAQASSAIKESDIDTRIGFLLSFKNIKLLATPIKKDYTIDIKLSHELDDFKSFDFIVMDENDPIATGSFSLMLQ
jgi:hypothetical protein